MGEATSQIQLVSAEVCPFAQRSRLVLLEKKLSFELVEINLDLPIPLGIIDSTLVIT